LPQAFQKAKPQEKCPELLSQMLSEESSKGSAKVFTSGLPWR
jgi:hypothetical protein